MTIKTLKEKLLKALDSVDVEKLSFSDMKQYAETLKAIAEVPEKSHSDLFASGLGFGFGYHSNPISDLK